MTTNRVLARSVLCIATAFLLAASMLAVPTARATPTQYILDNSAIYALQMGGSPSGYWGNGWNTPLDPSPLHDGNWASVNCPHVASTGTVYGSAYSRIVYRWIAPSDGSVYVTNGAYSMDVYYLSTYANGVSGQNYLTVGISFNHYTPGTPYGSYIRTVGGTADNTYAFWEMNMQYSWTSAHHFDQTVPSTGAETVKAGDVLLLQYQVYCSSTSTPSNGWGSATTGAPSSTLTGVDFGSQMLLYFTPASTGTSGGGTGGGGGCGGSTHRCV